MPKKSQNTVSLIEYQTKYSTKEACEKELYKLKWPNGFKCPYCGCTQHYIINARRLLSFVRNHLILYEQWK